MDAVYNPVDYAAALVDQLMASSPAITSAPFGIIPAPSDPAMIPGQLDAIMIPAPLDAAAAPLDAAAPASFEARLLALEKKYAALEKNGSGPKKCLLLPVFSL
ncbi:hypothetical protein H9P43_005041 [Blastocladiella emersonii ATCC 22665]|nr:hypothetical protein H9P43_005041 [Blastocladiella emersonii ATCC 22665]